MDRSFTRRGCFELSEVIPVRIQHGGAVLLDGKPCIAGPVLSGGRVFFDPKTGREIFLSEIAQMKMALKLRLTHPDDLHRLSASRQQSIETDWGTFTPQERHTALMRADFVRRLDGVEPVRLRVKKKVIIRIIDEVGRERGMSAESLPSPRQVREWYRNFIVAGRDVRALVSCDWAKGNRIDRYEDWQIVILNRVIDEKLATPTPSSLESARRAANLALKEFAEANGYTLALPGGAQGIGTKLLARMLRSRDAFQTLSQQTTVFEARREYQSVQLGPQGDEVNKEWETDHTLLDIIVIDENTRAIIGRPWLTVILDRYSRCIVGYVITFAPPSWVSVMDALRVAIMEKGEIEGVHNEWPCCGVPAVLITDNGRDFKSASMDGAAKALGFTLRHMKKRKPWLKGKVERWFRSLEEDIIHTLPGTTFSKIESRKHYVSEKMAILTIDEIDWIVMKWIVDVYHQKRHSKLGIAPVEAWRRGLKEIPLPYVPPEDLLIPMTGLIIPRSLSRGGIRYMGLRWDSEELCFLRGAPDTCVDVQIRLDPTDLSTIFVLNEKTRKWIPAQLIEPVEARGKSLDYWVRVKRLKVRLMKEEDLQSDIALATAMKEIDNFVQEQAASRLKSKAPKRLARFRKKSPPWKHIRPAHQSVDHSPPGSHSVGNTLVSSPPIQPHGPFTEATIPPASGSRPAAMPQENPEKSRASKPTGGVHSASATPSRAQPDGQQSEQEKRRLSSSKPTRPTNKCASTDTFTATPPVDDQPAVIRPIDFGTPGKRNERK
jgi:transposase InsO family protein